MKKVVIIGAGPAGLGCAHELTKDKNSQKEVIILEKNNTVGGLSRTIEYKNYLFDIGPHRFYTKNTEVLNLWKSILGKEFIEVNRLTRILYKSKLFLYPVRLFDTLTKLGFGESFQSLLSFIKAKLLLRNLEPKTFEDWTIKNFGRKLYSIFFKTYTEKIWGIPCNQIGAEWASQRIKNMNLIEVLRSAILGQKGRRAKSLVDKFNYPIKGAGYMYEAIAQKIKNNNGTIQTNLEVKKIIHNKEKIIAVEYSGKDKKQKIELDYLFSSMPLTQLILSLEPKPDKKIIEAAKNLYFREHITVNLIINKKDLFSDNWIYVHSPEVKMARIANYGNFSTKLLKDNDYSAISVEYFVFQKDEIWHMDDKELIELAINEIVKSNFCHKEEVIDGFVVRETESYPTYYLGYKKYFDLIKNYVDGFKNMQVIGRGGMYKYNNMDHSIYTGILAAKNYLQRTKKYNLWQINEDAQYLEERQL